MAHGGDRMGPRPVDPGALRIIAAVILSVFAVIGLPAGGASAMGAGPTSSPDGKPRLALVVANAAYSYIDTLNNPARDAVLLERTLRDVGFQVWSYADLDARAMRRAFVDFGTEVDAAGAEAVALVFYAGHGVQVDGTNYLVPVDARIRHPREVQAEAVAASDLLATLDTARKSPTIIILDACRNNPFPSGMRSVARGLARMDAPAGAIIAFSTAPGQVALDGDGGNSPYATALVQAMTRPGLSIERVFKTARNAVYQSTNGLQIPWESSSLFTDFSFTPGARPGGREEPALPDDRGVGDGGAPERDRVAAVTPQPGDTEAGAPREVLLRKGGELPGCDAGQNAFRLNAFWLRANGTPDARVIGRITGQPRDAIYRTGRAIQLGGNCRYVLKRTGTDGRPFAIFERVR